MTETLKKKDPELVKKKCAACGAESERKPKPEAKTVIEKNQVDFICSACGAVNLRNGTARIRVKKDIQKSATERKEISPKPKKDPGEPKKPIDPVNEQPKKSSLLNIATVVAVTCVVGFLGFRALSGRRSKAPVDPNRKKPVDPTASLT